MNFDGILSGVEKNSMLLGGAIGFFFKSGSSGINETMEIINNLAAGHVKMPDIGGSVEWFFNDGRAKNAIIAYLVGWAAKEFNVPVIGKHGTAIENLALGYAGGSLLFNFAWNATH